ncbi:MAG: hypothetical protein IJI14_06430 [Anaerolineaceae bacterium]|nr:hypothetical protein [Anaerolineaceae bacterium]
MEDAVLEREYRSEEPDTLLQNLTTADQLDASFADGKNGVKNALTDEFGFPFEPEGRYNSAPLEFEETVKALWVVLTNTNYAAVRRNRLSPSYSILMQHLEKYIKQMGACCITKEVLEKSGERFPGLDIINIKELHRMTSLHFRKCCDAYNDLQKSGQGQDMNMVSWIFRWASLSERLKATQDRINNIRSGKINIESLLARETVYKGESPYQKDHSHRLVGSWVKSSSLPVIKSFARDVKARKAAEEKAEKKIQRQAEQAAKRLEKTAAKLPAEFRDPIIRPYPVPKINGLGLTPRELKQLLMDEAKKRGDMAEAGIIAAETTNQLIERFKKFQEPERVRGSDPQNDPRSGPSAETRKKLREKRKKKK